MTIRQLVLFVYAVVFALLVWSSVRGAASPAQKLAWGKPVKGTEIAVSFDRLEVRPGEPVRVTLWWRNITKKPINYLAMAYVPHQFRFSILCDDGKPVSLTSLGKALAKAVKVEGLSATTVALYPGEVIKQQECNLARTFKLSKAGRYTVVASYLVPTGRKYDKYAIAPPIKIIVTDHPNDEPPLQWGKAADGVQAAVSTPIVKPVPYYANIRAHVWLRNATDHIIQIKIAVGAWQGARLKIRNQAGAESALTKLGKQIVHGTNWAQRTITLAPHEIRSLLRLHLNDYFIFPTPGTYTVQANIPFVLTKKSATQVEAVSQKLTIKVTN